MARQFPASIQVDGTSEEGRAARIEGVRAGDSLVLSMVVAPQAGTVIEVLTASGEDLGYLRKGNELYKLRDDRSLERILPYVSTSVESVTPVSKRRKGTKNALLKVKMELVPGTFDPESSSMSLDVLDAIAQGPKEAEGHAIRRVVEAN